MGILRVLGPDQSTVLFDFDDSTGAANPSTVITNLAAPLDLGSIDPALALELRTHGAAILGSPTLPTVEMRIPFMASAATDTALFEGLGQLYRYLLSASRDHPIYLDWTELSATRYIDVVGISEMPNLIRGQAQAGIVAGRKSTLGPLELRLLRQPWMRLATVTTSGVTVPNDPATSTKVRVYPITVTGDLPTPGRVRVQMDAGSVERILIGQRSQKSRASTYFSDYLSETGFSQAEASARGWTVTRAADTTTASVATASPGSGTSYAVTAFSSNPTIMAEKVKFTRTTLMDSLRGTWDIVARVNGRLGGVNGNYELQASWAPNASGEPIETFDPVPLDTTLTTGTAWGEVILGRLSLPDTVSLGGLQIRLYARRLSGSSDLGWDFVWLVPSDHVTVVVPGGVRQTWHGDELVTPSGITADPAWAAGAVVGDATRLNANNEAAGTPPSAGFDAADGRHRVIYRVTLNAFAGTVTRRITNETDNTEILEKTIVSGSGTRILAEEFDAVAAKNYLYSVQITSYTSGSVDVEEITDDFLASLTTNESARTEPGPRRYGVDRLDSSGNLAGFLGCEGEVPVLLEPGANHLFFRVEDIKAAGYEEPESVLSRIPTVTVAYDPRMAL